MFGKLSTIALLVLIVLVACSGSGPSAGDEKAAPLFIGSLRYIADHCGDDAPSEECEWRNAYIAQVCALAQIGGGDFDYIEDCHLSDYFAPFCDRLEIIAAEPAITARPHLIELAQDIDAAFP